MHIGIRFFCFVLYFFISSVNAFCETPATIDTLRDIVSLETAFGDVGIDDEYLLVAPNYFCVDNNMNIYVFDEQCIKVFSYDGQPVNIIGGTGQGPGEFNSTSVASPGLTVGPTGYIAADNFNWYNVYGPDYTFVHTIPKDEKPAMGFSIGRTNSGIGSGAGQKIIVLNESDFIELKTKVELKDGKNKTEFELLFRSGRKKDKIVSYKSQSENTVPASNLIWDVTENNIVVYTRSAVDEENENGQNFYIINFYDPGTKKTSKIRHRFLPVRMPPEIVVGQKMDFFGFVSPLKQSAAERKKLIEEHQRKKNEEIERLRKNPKENDNFYPAIFNIVIDGSFLIIVRDGSIDNENVYLTERLIDVFDLESGEYLRSAYMPLFSVIRNGHAFRIVTPTFGSLPKVEVYSINQNLYSK